MTLVTGGEPPRHSKWHVISGTIVLLSAFVVAMFAIEPHLRRDAAQATPQLSEQAAPSPVPPEPTELRVASRD